MAPSNRSAQFTKVAKILKSHYKAVKSDTDRPVLEHLLFACCLEDAHYEPAEEAYATLKHTFFDFNEIRVTSIAELSEVMAALPDPRAAANRLKRLLQAVFEATYEFNLDELRKKNLGPTVKWLEQLDGSTTFIVGYVVQAALGGHSIPIDTGTMQIMAICDLVTEKNIKAGNVPGLERAIPKSKGVEFGSMLHQFAADFTANPYSPAVREILLNIEPGCKDRLPKRRSARKKKAEAEEAAAAKKAEKKAAQEKAQEKQAAKKAPAKKTAKKDEKKTPAKKKAAKKDVKEKPAKKKATKKAKSGKTAASTKKPAKKTPKKAAKKAAKKSTAKGLSKRKPR